MATTKKAAAKKGKKKVKAYPYKVGDIIRTTLDQDGWMGIARVRILESGYPENVMKLDKDGRDIDTWYLSERVRTTVELVERDGKKVSGKGKALSVKAPAAPELGMKFALKYDLSSDPVELFATKAEVKARIAELVATERYLKKESIWVYKVSAPKHVTVSTAISAF